VMSFRQKYISALRGLSVFIRRISSQPASRRGRLRSSCRRETVLTWTRLSSVRLLLSKAAI
jgi:hypothetical protein